MRCQSGEGDRLLSLKLRAEVMHLATSQLPETGPPAGRHNATTPGANLQDFRQSMNMVTRIATRVAGTVGRALAKIAQSSI
jgi:hypothetical protein